MLMSLGLQENHAGHKKKFQIITKKKVLVVK